MVTCRITADRFERQCARGFEPCLHIRATVLDGLERADLAAELPPVFRVFNSLRKNLVGPADAVASDRMTTGSARERPPPIQPFSQCGVAYPAAAIFANHSSWNITKPVLSVPVMRSRHPDGTLAASQPLTSARKLFNRSTSPPRHPTWIFLLGIH
jgi:hypothetical protein